MRRLLLWLIGVYQRRVSPYKGFRCAYRVHTGRASCSVLGHRAIRRFGAAAGLRILRSRLDACGEVHRRVRPVTTRLPSRQLGSVSCDLPCDLPHFDADAIGSVCDCVGWDSCWPFQSRSRDERERARQRRRERSQAIRAT